MRKTIFILAIAIFLQIPLSLGSNNGHLMPDGGIQIPKLHKAVAIKSIPALNPPAIAELARVEVADTHPQVSSAVSQNVCADAKSCIYSGESGNDPTSKNGGGCYGIGQDCNGIVENLCGADYACQDVYFTGYMQRRYGTWEIAWAFWQRTDPRPYPGHWW